MAEKILSCTHANVHSSVVGYVGSFHNLVTVNGAAEANVHISLRKVTLEYLW